MRLSGYFKSRAVVGVLVAAVAGVAVAQGEPPGDDAVPDIARLVPGEGKLCASLSSVFHPQTPVERYVAKQYAMQQTTVIGRMLINAQDDPELAICFNRALDKSNSCGIYYIGLSDKKEVLLNPAERVSDRTRDIFTVHESRHRFQAKLGLRYSRGGNIPEQDRVVLYWMIEADARMAAVLYAYERAQQGDRSYEKALSVDHGDMIHAFYGELHKSGDVALSAGAAMKAFLLGRVFTVSYANETANLIEKRQIGFNPSLPEDTLFTPQMLVKMGNIGAYGNYMTPEIVETFRDAFKAEDYAKLKQARRVNGGISCGR